MFIFKHMLNIYSFRHMLNICCSFSYVHEHMFNIRSTYVNIRCNFSSVQGMIAMVHLIDSRDKRRLTINPCSIALSAYQPAIPKWLDPKTMRSKEIISKSCREWYKIMEYMRNITIRKREKKKDLALWPFQCPPPWLSGWPGPPQTSPPPGLHRDRTITQ